MRERSPLLTYRLAKSKDARQIAELSRDLIESGLGWSWHPPRVLRAIADRDINVLIATAQTEIAGFAIMEFGETQAHLALLGVRPAYRRCGIGTRLIEWLAETAIGAGIVSVDLELRASNLGARRFYEQLGFVEIAHVPGYYRGVETAIRMARDIRRITKPRINFEV
jgi:ribosomal-protein-alanine N-acetyltransferase